MSINLSFHVMHDCQMSDTRTAQSAVAVVHHYGDMHSFISQFVDMTDAGYDEPTVPTQPVFRGLKLYISEESPSETRSPYNEETLRFCYAGDVKNAVLPDGVGQFDHAMMAYLNALDDDTPLVLYVC